MPSESHVIVIVAIIVLGYLLGSLPFAYLAGRVMRGIDIRQFGTGSVGSSNAYEQVSKRLLLVVGLLDVGKATLPSWLAMRLGLGDDVAILAGLAAVVGHCWPLFLGFHCGRGISPSLGVLAALFPWGFLYELVAIGIGSLARHALVNLMGLATMPILAWVLGQPPAVIAGSAAMFVIVAVKRMEANRAPLPEGQLAWRALLRRLVLDRDAEDWEAWICRRPEGAAPPWRIAGRHKSQRK